MHADYYEETKAVWHRVFNRRARNPDRLVMYTAGVIWLCGQAIWDTVRLPLEVLKDLLAGK